MKSPESTIIEAPNVDYALPTALQQVVGNAIEAALSPVDPTRQAAPEAMFSSNI